MSGNRGWTGTGVGVARKFVKKKGRVLPHSRVHIPVRVYVADKAYFTFN